MLIRWRMSCHLQERRPAPGSCHFLEFISLNPHVHISISQLETSADMEIARSQSSLFWTRVSGTSAPESAVLVNKGLLRSKIYL